MSNERKLTKSLAKVFRPKSQEIARCETLVRGVSDAPTCAKVNEYSLGRLPENTAQRGRPLRPTADNARQLVCRIQRACPVSNHRKEGDRGMLPCMQTREDLEKFLRKT